MLFAQKSNRVQPITNAEVQKFLNLGYNITDETGAIIHEAMPDDITALKASFKRHTEEIGMLKKKLDRVVSDNSSLKSENEELMARVETLTNMLENQKTTRSRARKEKDATEE